MTSLLFIVIVSGLVSHAVSLQIPLHIDKISTSVEEERIYDAWLSYKQAYQKSYDEEEEGRRFMLFHQNVERVIEHNHRYKAGESSYQKGINKFSDWTQEEISTLVGLLPTRGKSTGSTYLLPASPIELPTSVDWREKHAVTPVKNQGNCGSCWAFSATGAIEGQTFRKIGRLVSLSEQQLVDCSSDFQNNGCGGGLMDNAFRYLISAGGIESEETYPYTSGTSEEQNEDCFFSKDNMVAKITGFTDIQPGNDSQLLHAVALVGPISVGIATTSNFMGYKQGIYDSTECSPELINHGVLLIGYGIADGIPYWLVKNSWGTDWGENGYVRMSRKITNFCGISGMSSYPLV